MKYSEKCAFEYELQNSEVSQAMEGVLLYLVYVVLLEGSAQTYQKTDKKHERT